MPVTVTNNLDLEARVKRVQDEIAAGLSRILPTLRREIVERTQSGNSFDSGPFPGYSDSYAKAKAAALGSSTPVNLTLSGDMLNSITTTVRNDSRGVYGTIEVTGDFNREKARWNQGGNSSIPPRRFMGLTDDQKARVREVFTDAISRALRT